MIAAATEPTTPPEPTITGPDETLLVPVPLVAEVALHRLANRSQAPLSAIVASWLAVGEGAPVVAGSAAAVAVHVPAPTVASLRAEARRRNLTVGEVASARLAIVAGRR